MPPPREGTPRGVGRLCAAVIGLAITGCAPDRALTLRVAGPVEKPARGVVLMFADGLDAARADELARAGRLPNLSRRFIDGGAVIEHAISGLPPITYAVTASLITGELPGHHGIVGNRWFDRDTLLMEDYITASTYLNCNHHFGAPTVFEMLSDRFTVNVQLHTRRGVHSTFDVWLPENVSWIVGDYVAFDAGVTPQIERLSNEARAVGRWPSLVTIYWPGVDEVGHRDGVGSEAYAQAVCNIDAQVGRVIDAYERAGLGDSTYFMLVSDHGHVAVDAQRWCDVAGALRRGLGWRVCDRTRRAQDFASRVALLGGYDAVVLPGAYRACPIHMRGRGGWHERPAPADVEALLTRPLPVAVGAAPVPLAEHPAVELAAVRLGDGRVRVISRRGRAVIERDGAGRYTLRDEAGDVLGYRSRSPADRPGGPRTSREWLTATANARIPDFVPQVVEMFESPRAGDAVLFASDGGTFMNAERGGHGSCLAADMRTVWMVCGPDVPRGGRVCCARSVDVVPTILDLLGEGRRAARYPGIDGVSIADEIRRAPAESAEGGRP